MVTISQAVTANEFHYHSPKTGRIMRWRRNGKTKLWKTRPTEFSIPIKFGLYNHGYLTHENAHLFHVAHECPDNFKERHSGSGVENCGDCH